MGTIYDRSRKWHRHTYRCRHPRTWGASCAARCTVCGCGHLEPETVTLPGEITPFVDWHPAPDDDRGEYRSRFVWPQGEVRIDLEVVAPRSRPVGGGNPAPNDQRYTDETPRRKRQWSHAGYRTVVLEADDLARLRLDWRIEWFRPDDGEIVQSEDGYVLVVARCDDDEPVVVVEAVEVAAPRPGPYPRTRDELRRWRTTYR